MRVLLYTSALEIIFAKSIIIDYRGGSTPKNSCVLRARLERARCMPDSDFVCCSSAGSKNVISDWDNVD